METPGLGGKKDAQLEIRNVLFIWFDVSFTFYIECWRDTELNAKWDKNIWNILLSKHLWKISFSEDTRYNNLIYEKNLYITQPNDARFEIPGFIHSFKTLEQYLCIMCRYVTHIMCIRKVEVFWSILKKVSTFYSILLIH